MRNIFARLALMCVLILGACSVMAQDGKDSAAVEMVADSAAVGSAADLGDEEDVLVAPVLYEEVRERRVYLPEGRWININDGSEWDGGQTITAPAPYEAIPVFVKKGSEAAGMLVPEK